MGYPKPSRLEVKISAKISGLHWWHNSSSHAAELTAGALTEFWGVLLLECPRVAHMEEPVSRVTPKCRRGYYNTNDRNAYLEIAEAASIGREEGRDRGNACSGAHLCCSVWRVCVFVLVVSPITSNPEALIPKPLKS